MRNMDPRGKRSHAGARKETPDLPDQLRPAIERDDRSPARPDFADSRATERHQVRLSGMGRANKGCRGVAYMWADCSA